VKIGHEERFAFYERSKKAYATIQTGESALYACVILTTGRYPAGGIGDRQRKIESRA
jgi:L-fucose mutarotase/ribose pyranase (RbsD/FucU family)